ncbi:hypothetical protein E1A91_A12G165000v1 [Gossypium mustelinum]|uniref:Rubisco LSMT substrate-binding domain-containing protein n=1 Tax=Gossypium mustelinum TaxID=34275 RepID=A0A5D2WUI8_GOSMU|nr:hypothetical protein E1A91_A12G165000v1 [Gossypium mustelinum]
MAAAKLLIPTLSHFRPLTCAAAVSATNPARLVPHPPDLLKWIKREGGFVHEAVTITQDTTYGLGLVASGGIPKGSDLIVLPEHFPLKFQSDKDDEADSVLLPLSNRVPEELWAMKLGLKLLQERAKVGSFWWPYISNLPETYTVPIFFSGEDIKNLQYAPLLCQVNKRCRFLLEFEQEVKNVLKNLKPSEHPFGGQDVDASSLGWAMSAVSSRAFRLYGKKLPNGTHSDIPMMLPLIDMCNHSFNPNARILQEQDAGNPKMLIKVTIGGPELVEGRLLAALRVLLSNDREMVQRYNLSVLKSLSAEGPLGVANEVAAFRTIIALCVIALGHFPTKIMDDESLLKQGVSVSTELAIQFRMQKKSVIIDVMRDLTKRVKVLLSKETTTA